MENLDIERLKHLSAKISNYADQILNTLDYMRQFSGARNDPRISEFVRAVLSFKRLDTIKETANPYDFDYIVLVLKQGFKDFAEK